MITNKVYNHHLYRFNIMAASNKSWNTTIKMKNTYNGHKFILMPCLR
ncbi:hypothetical protein [Chitinophaga sp. Cy-1792]|nr:hypothetical protein [Chitinophaga sp. Cy-1792]